ncbi:hypothetical protein EMCRGX_G000025 [Ephydatia muelleri]
MATVVYGGRGRWRVLCRAAADILASLQCRKHGALLLPTAHTPPSFLCSSSIAALKPEHFYRVERGPAAAEKETPLDKQTGSGRGGNSEKSEKVWQYLKGRLQLELGSDVTNQREVLLLCCTLSDVEERVERLLEAGFSEEWAAILLPLFPPLWDADVTHMRRVFELLEERGFGGNALKKIVSEHSYLLMEDKQLIERRLNELLEMGIEKQQIVSMFTAHPLLFGFHLGGTPSTPSGSSRGNTLEANGSQVHCSIARRSVTMGEKSTPGGSVDLPPTEEVAPFSERPMAWIANIVAGTSAQSLPPSSQVTAKAPVPTGTDLYSATRYRAPTGATFATNIVTTVVRPTDNTTGTPG